MSKFNELIKGETPVLVEFYADWAPTCEEVSGDLKKLKAELGSAFKMVRIDFDKNEAVARKMGVVGVPSVILFKEGKKLFSASGIINLEEIRSKV
ncbi:thioredoxin family protein [Parvicella tangerina]|uniref:Thioredoxin-like protein n=1 Tax=Parvicella tangerina TaxID=2829795 RepID=A0A916JNN2_9FLAO|nr:thioredoxin family protein [Parvicella tangerina]CAG5084122.1 Thioredoxin-like protein [Parvicella tangerina]